MGCENDVIHPASEWFRLAQAIAKALMLRTIRVHSRSFVVGSSPFLGL
jgi:hypothetical protein